MNIKNDLFYESKVRNVLDIYSQIELDLLELIIEKLKETDGEIGGSLEWYIKRLNDLGGLNSDTIKIISKYTKKTNGELKRMLNDIGIKTIDDANLINAYKKGKITINPETFYSDPTIHTIINNSFNETLKTFLNINENIEKNVRKQYIEILNTAYLETSSGVYDYKTSIRKALNNFADKGITGATYLYPDGTERKYDIAGIVRRDLLTATNQLSGKISENLVDELDPEYIWLSEHFFARPTHAEWQGCYVKKEDFIGVTGYGEVDGIYGVNCKHKHFPFFGDVDETQYITLNGYKLYTQDRQVDEKENNRLYELSQKQRYLERQVRRWKRRELTDENKDNASNRVKTYQKQLRELINSDDELRRDYLREKI